MTKRIGIDARLLYQTGIGTYTRNLLYYLDKLPIKNLEFYIYLLSGDELNINNDKFKTRFTNCRWHSVDEQISFLNQLKSDNLNLMHFTYFSFPFLYQHPFIATIHDLTPLIFKTGKASTKNALFYQFKYQIFKFILSRQVSQSVRIITPSQAVKKQIVDNYGQAVAEKIYPVHEGIDYALMNCEQNHDLRSRFSNNFIIYVGNFYPHKNIETLIKAYAQIKTDIKLILLGPNDYFSKSIRQLIEKLNLQDKVIQFSSSKKADLVFFYKNALVLIHPSLSEGFGLPIVDAMYFGLPIIASDIPVFKEIIGQNYNSFDPYSIEDISKKIRQFLDKADFKKINYSARLENLSFKKMAEQTRDLYLASL